MNVCTIIAKNYVAQARVLARSFATHHPDGRFWTLVIDDFDGFIDPAAEPFEVLTPADIGCERFEEMAARYDVLELSTAVKPWLLRQLMGQTGRPVTYLDPDIKIYRSLERLDELAARHGVVLIPHNSEPIPPDGLAPSQVDIMVSGVYNLGYVSLAPRDDVERLLDWWADRLLRDCRVDPQYGYFVDQRWFDLTPGFLTDFAIVRDPEYNVAYWNLHSRRLEHDGARYLVDGRPLAFFHFSGFDPEQPFQLSKYQNRIKLADRPALKQICAEYKEEVRREGFDMAGRWPYTYGIMPNGVPFDRAVRGLYAIGADSGEVHGSPFTRDGATSLMAWMAAPAPDMPPGINRLLGYLYRTRRDLRKAFPDLGGPDRSRLFQWVLQYGVHEVPALAHLPSHAGSGDTFYAPALAAPPSDLWGVNVVGYFRSELGVGEAARQVVGALDARGIPVLPVHGGTIPLSRQGHPFTHFDYTDAEYPVNLICMNADMLPEFAQQTGEGFFASRYSIGLWFWEVNRFRKEWMASFEHLDEVWLPTAHVAEAIAAVSPIPTRTMRIPVEMPPLVPRSRADLGVPDGFLFLFSFDYRSVFERKNPLAVIDAYTRAFSPDDGASLVIKCINAEADPVNHQRLVHAAVARPDVHIVDRYFTPQDKDALTAICDCYVSLHRSEGFGLTLAEAMYCGRPVIATGYSGNLDFMTPENSLLVEHRLVPIGQGADPYPADGEWAEPDVAHAASLMRKVFDDRRFAVELGRRGQQDITRTHSRTAAGEMIERRLEELRANRDEWVKEGAKDDGAVVVPSLRPQIEAGPARYEPAGPLRRNVRRAVLRALRPFTRYQETINVEVTRSLEGVGRELERTRARLTRSNAAVLERIRRQEHLNVLPPILEAQGRVIDEVKHAVAPLRFQTDRSLYVAVAELRRSHEAVGDSPEDEAQRGELTPWELRGFSQNGEDGVLAEVLRRVGAPARHFVEFGVEGGREGNCVFLADVVGWSGLFMEGERQRYAELERKYAPTPRVRTQHAMVSPDNVQELFGQADVPREPDVLAIDVDGADYWIWEAITDYRPRVVIIEYNSALGPGRALVQPREHRTWDGTEFFGASIGAIRRLGQEKGYRLVHTELAGVNAFLVRADLAEGRFPSPELVPVRSLPNYFQSGYRHPPDPHDRRYLDLESGELVSARSEAAPADSSNGASVAAPAISSPP